MITVCIFFLDALHINQNNRRMMEYTITLDWTAIQMKIWYRHHGLNNIQVVTSSKHGRIVDKRDESASMHNDCTRKP